MEIGPRDSIHMFKKGVKPRWEDPRNEKGGRQCSGFKVLMVRMLEFSHATGEIDGILRPHPAFVNWRISY
jgi:hypothetical protein